MSSVWVPVVYKGITPSVFRHLAHWPETLGLYRNRLCNLPADTHDRLKLLSNQAIDSAAIYANRLVPTGEAMPALSEADQQWLREALDLFINGMISRGVVIVPSMRALLTPTNG